MGGIMGEVGLRTMNHSCSEAQDLVTQEYRQNYCGCLMSDLEAREERAARKAARNAARATAEREAGSG